MALLAAYSVQLFGQTVPPKDRISNANLDPTDLYEQATRVLNNYCVSCHGPEKQKGDLRLDSLETIDVVDRHELYINVQEVIRLAEMPPENAKQPNEAARKILLHWLNRQLTGKAALALAEKLWRFEYGNVITHEDLFSGKYAEEPGYTPDRRWLISEFIFTGNPYNNVVINK